MDDAVLLFIIIVGGIFAYAIWNINYVNEARARERVRDDIIRSLIETEVDHRQGVGCGGCFTQLAFIVLAVTLIYMLLTAQPY